MPASTFSRCFAALGAAALLVWSSCAGAQDFIDPNLRWRTLQTEHFTVHFAEQQRDHARRAAAVAERILPRITRILRWEPKEPTQIVILDSADFSNGFATPIPFNLSGIFLSPPDDGELLQNREWLEMVLSHELFHIVHLDKARGTPLALRNVFGRFPLLFPNAVQPTWIIEGLAVYNETDVARGYGRLENTHFEGMMRAEVARGLRSLAELNADGRGFPLNRNYLYGSYFFAFLRERYGEHAVIGFIENYSNNLGWAPVDSNPRRSTGKSMSELWPEFEEWLRTRFAPKEETPSQEGEILLKAWTIFSPALSANGERWYMQGDGYTVPQLMRRNREGKADAVRSVEQDTRIAPMGGGAVLLSQLEICDNYNLYYDLYRIDASGSRRRLTECARNRFAAPLDDGRIAAIRVLQGEAEVVMLDGSGKVLRTLYRATAGESLTGLAARDGSVVVTSLRGEQWSLVEIGAAEPVVLVSDSAIKHSPRFGSSTDEVFFIADYGKIYNVWSVKRGSRALSRWTRSLNGVRETSAPVDGELLLVSIEADGDALRLYQMPGAPLEQRYAASLAGRPESQAEPSLAADDKAYSPWSTLRPRNWFPILVLGEGMFALGFQTFGADALFKHQYVVAPMYEFNQQEFLGYAEYLYDGRHSVILNREMVVKSQENDNGDIIAYTTREQAQWVSLWRHLALNARFYWGLGAALERERLHNVKVGINSSLQDERVAGLVAGYDSRRQQWLSEGPSQGTQLRGFAETSNGLGGAFSGNVYRGDLRSHVPLGRSVLGLRWMEGWGQPNAEAFQLGGLFSDDFTFTPRLNQREFALRGYGSGEPSLTGHRARLWTAEWRMPLSDVDRALMTPPVGINRISLNVFADVGAAWERGGSPDYHRGFGIELMAEPSFLYLFGWQARAGIARGVDEAGKTQFYLRAGRSF
ncbi:MAG TPA: hypothetical protein VM140_13160 [Burkholderiales bacterium]|nr:hypothetical protein [Burkholderiales bacterium]